MDALPSELIHPEWNGIYLDSGQLSDTADTDMGTVEGWVVDLKFQAEGRSSSGTGFFLNMPGMQDHELILTSAQNLIDAKGNEVEVLVVSDSNKRQLEIVEMRYCPEYCRTRKPEYDYAAVKVKRTTAVTEGRGFGFSMCLGAKERLSGRVGVTGYPGRSAHEPTTLMGPVLTDFEKGQEFLEYGVATDEGLTGSPVWMGYDGFPTAVAIHNRKQGGVSGSRASGSRLTPAVLREIFLWLGIGRYAAQLQAQMPPDTSTSSLLSGGLYLYFSSDYPFARVKLGKGSVFDVLPAQIVAQSAQVYYALSYRGMWVLFDSLQQEVVLHDHINDRCLFFEDKQRNKHIGIVLARKENGRHYQLRIQDDMIYGADNEESETSEVSLVEYPATKSQFVIFRFAP